MKLAGEGSSFRSGSGSVETDFHSLCSHFYYDRGLNVRYRSFLLIEVSHRHCDSEPVGHEANWHPQKNRVTEGIALRNRLAGDCSKQLLLSQQFASKETTFGL